MGLELLKTDGKPPFISLLGVSIHLKQCYCDIFAQFVINLHNKFVLCSTLYTRMLITFPGGKKFYWITVLSM